MNATKEPIIKHKVNGKYIDYILTINPEEYHCEFVLEEVGSWEGENGIPCDKEVVIRGVVKWDGCSHVNFGDEEGYIHLCGKTLWKKLSDILPWCYEEVVKELATYDAEVGE